MHLQPARCAIASVPSPFKMFSRISAALQRAALSGRLMSSSSKGSGKKWDNTQIGLTVGAVALVGIAASYAAVPLYQMFCRLQVFGAVGRGDPAEAAAKAAAHKDEPVRPITVRFTSDVSSNLPWSFVPVQKSIKIVPGACAAPNVFPAHISALFR